MEMFSFSFPIVSNVLTLKTLLLLQEYFLKSHYMVTVVCFVYVSLSFPITNIFRLMAVVVKYINHGTTSHMH